MNRQNKYKWKIQPTTIPKNTVQFALAQSDEQSIVLPKTHAHVMMTQLNINDGLNAFGNKGDEAILKEIKQLHTWQALMPCSSNKFHMKWERKHSDT